MSIIQNLAIKLLGLDEEEKTPLPRVEITPKKSLETKINGNLNIKGAGVSIDTPVEPEYNSLLIEQKFAEIGLKVKAVDYQVGGITETHALYVPDTPIDIFLTTKTTQRIMGKFGLKEKPTITTLKGDWYDSKGNVLREDIIEITFIRNHNEIQHLGDYLNSKTYWDTKGELVFPLGRSSKPLFADLANFPHALITGTSGAGKSEFVNNMILSIHHRYEREDVQFAFIDPKKVEFTIFQNSPLVALYGNQDDRKRAFFTKVNEAVDYLGSLLDTMDGRLERLLSARCKNIKQYNKKNPIKKMPYLVVVIDELASLMEQGDKEILTYVLGRLTAEARATGIILIVATQTPRAEILPGRILGNLLTRVIFKAGNKTESDQVLKIPEALDLAGDGDGIYVDKRNKKHRFTGVFLDESIDELENIIYWEV